MTAHDRQCTVLLGYDSPFIKESDFMEKLESKDEAVKVDALKALIASLVNGEQYPKLLMSVIKFCLHSESHAIKKLLLLYWEVVEKKNKEGVLLHEMILVCNALKNNITHPNEYIRGSTLRFLCKIKEQEILESLIPSITDNLQHRHSCDTTHHLTLPLLLTPSTPLPPPQPLTSLFSLLSLCLPFLQLRAQECGADRVHRVQRPPRADP